MKLVHNAPQRFFFCICLIFIFLSHFVLTQDILSQKGIFIEDIEPVLGEDGLFLTGPLDVSEASLIGLTLSQSLSDYGPPKSVFSVRGEHQWQDDVVFFYKNSMYFYVFENRVWQVRFDYRYSGMIAGLTMGQKQSNVIVLLGSPHYTGVNSLFYDVQDRGFPIRLRLIFKKNLLHDMYLYRSDF